MVAAAAAAGITLTAESAWRDSQEQIQLRIQNCGGDSHFNIYERDSGECTPRTAIPGSSRHERGLAVDFSNCDWGSPNFSWLSANAGNYHLYLLNTNDEPWHWSWDGN
jgi:LAS superfamily LD-carboxypeptidase LdcB